MKKVITVVMDGFGLREEVGGNAVIQALTPNYDALLEKYPHTSLEASEGAVGLLPGQFGNSEVGHMTIGAGRIVKQKETRIDEFFETNAIEENEVFKEMINEIVLKNKTVHLMGLLSDGGVHSHIKHFKKVLEKLKEHEIKDIYIHAITDGRDTDTKSGIKYLTELQETLGSLKVGKIASVSGRYYAMDRDNKWERTRKYYDMIVKGIAIKASNAVKTVNTCYAKGITDEFIPPILLDDAGMIGNNDVIFWLNFRPDRARQILMALTAPKFNGFLVKPLNVSVYSFMEINKDVTYKYMLETLAINNSLGVYLSELGLTQARVAETEKYAHVTTFFDGLYDGPLENCDKFLIPSPKVATYDLMPEMSALEVCKRALKCMEKDYDYIFVNFANPDMVGHTGDLVATIKAVQVVDACLGKIIEAAENNFYTVFVLSDHGNADIMADEKGNPVTTHTINPVPFIITDDNIELKKIKGGLSNIAPTILDYMDIGIPKEMEESKSLLDNGKEVELD